MAVQLSDGPAVGLGLTDEHSRVLRVLHTVPSNDTLLEGCVAEPTRIAPHVNSLGATGEVLIATRLPEGSARIDICLLKQVCQVPKPEDAEVITEVKENTRFLLIEFCIIFRV